MNAPLQLVIVRHGEAGRGSGSDAERVLTERGRAEVVATANALSGQFTGRVDIVCSPLVRARQTAALLAEGLGADAPQVIPGITPDDEPVRALHNLGRLMMPGRTLVVASHMPLVGALAALLEGGDLRLAPGVPTGACLVMQGDSLAPGRMVVTARHGHW